jgi:hypothetical protein
MRRVPERERNLHAERDEPRSRHASSRKIVSYSLGKEATNHAFLSHRRPRGEVDLVCAVRARVHRKLTSSLEIDEIMPVVFAKGEKQR